MHTRLVILGSALILSTPGVSTRAPLVIHGRVSDASTGKPVAGAGISVTDSKYSATTDGSGQYRLVVDKAPADTVRLVVRRIGYMPATSSIAVGGRIDIVADFALKQSSTALEAVVTTGISVRGVTLRGRADGVRAPTMSDMMRRQNVPGDIRHQKEAGNTESYDVIDENPFLLAGDRPLSTFSVDVDRASYSNIRRFLNSGQAVPKDAVRIEEMVNYFPYAYPNPAQSEPVSIVTGLGKAPWNRSHQLLMIGLKARPISLGDLPPNNLVFLIDVSGSMESDDKLPLVKSAFELLVNQLRPQDRVSIVVYAGNAGLVLPSTSGSEKTAILDAIARLEAGGSTAGGAGLRLAYDVAQKNFIRSGNNRVILATDGDFNVGVSSDAEMVRLIEERRASGVFLTALGFGTGNLKDSKMEKLADHGNGHYAYVDNLLEAKKVFVRELGATLRTVAKDVKLQLEFNPARVAAYRLIGYENRLLNDADFANDAKDAGDMGAGHTVTALYEIIPVGTETDPDLPEATRLRYQQMRSQLPTARSKELLTLKLRYKEPDASRSNMITRVVRDDPQVQTPDFRFASAVAEFGLLLRESKYRKNASYRDVIETVRQTLGEDQDGLRSEFIDLVRKASTMQR
jgi:Ca-activated chloride channel family protein